MQFQIDDMSCSACVRSIEKAVAAVDAQAVVEADLGARQIRVQTSADKAQIVAALQEAGFPPKPL
ncbi:heavy metal transport/detoxification protein [Lysobacteraceae bacterium NML03-0222]|nr:heavy metal transport/detoxification protein [Xanthomonadaceae bacterium NML03-0222]PJK07300.1 heavy metal transport/detoxification protein [Xanthomonadaceae bacterium NML71-0210]